VYLISGSILENIGLGLDPEDIDVNKCWKVLEAVHLSSWVASLENGLLSVVGERGSKLSGGQRQRIGIARALYQDPILIVLDEATSALDAESEYEISKSIEAMKHRVTTVVIAHRLSTVKNCDSVAYLQGGELVAQGTFDELRDPKMRILVAGAAGFLGSHMCDRLLEAGNEVIGVDNFYTGSRSNIAHLEQSSRFEFIRHDVTFPLYIECDYVMNFACPASPIHYQKNPAQTMKTNVHGAINLLGLAKRLSIPIFQASTSEVYGDPEIHPQPEAYWGNVNPIGPRACYDEGKRAAETLFFDYHRQFKVQIKVVRIFNTYGPRMAQDDGRVVSNFIVAALRNQNLEIYGDGKQTRSFCYVDDLISGINAFCFNSNHTGPMNIGTEFEYTIHELAEMIIKLTNSESNIVFHEKTIDDPMQRKPNLALARELINWSPSTQVEDGLRKTIEYFQDWPILDTPNSGKSATMLGR
jgi:UDP-glucuronate decarboxylase